MLKHFFLLTIYFSFQTTIYILILLIYLVLATLIFGVSFTILIPLCYFYSVVLIVRKLIVWREVGYSAAPLKQTVDPVQAPVDQINVTARNIEAQSEFIDGKDISVFIGEKRDEKV